MKEQFITQILVSPKKKTGNITMLGFANTAAKLGFKMFEWNGNVYSTHLFMSLNINSEIGLAQLFSLNDLIDYKWP